MEDPLRVQSNLSMADTGFGLAEKLRGMENGGIAAPAELPRAGAGAIMWPGYRELPSGRGCERGFLWH